MYRGVLWLADRFNRRKDVGRINNLYDHETPSGQPVFYFICDELFFSAPYFPDIKNSLADESVDNRRRWTVAWQILPLSIERSFWSIRIFLLALLECHYLWPFYSIGPNIVFLVPVSC